MKFRSEGNARLLDRVSHEDLFDPSEGVEFDEPSSIHPHTKPPYPKIWVPMGYLFLGLLFVLPLTFGGRSELAGSSIKLALFSSFCVQLMYWVVLARSKNFPKNIFKRSGRVLVWSLPFCLYLVAQIIPLPLNALKSLSPLSYEAYSAVGAVSGFISLDPKATLNGLTWVVAFVLTLSVLSAFPALGTEIKMSGRSKRRKSVRLSAQSGIFDLYSERLVTTCILVSLICGVIGVTHVVLKLQSLFGILRISDDFIPTQRAHWPFANANQLAFCLEIGFLLLLGRILRARKLRLLEISSSARSRGLSAIFSSMLREFERQILPMTGLFFLGISLLMTMSRAGVILTTVAAYLISLLYFKFEVVVLPKMVKHDGGRGSGVRNKNKLRLPFVLKTLIYPMVFLGVLLSFMGDESYHRISGRFEHAIERTGDQSRASLNNVTKDVFVASPWVGVGLNSWSSVAPQFSPADLAGWKLDYAHNEYFQVVSEVGLVGLFLISVPLSYVLFSLWAGRAMFHEPVKKFYFYSLLISLMAPALHAAVDFPYHLPMLSLLFLSLIVLVMRFCQFESARGV